MKVKEVEEEEVVEDPNKIVTIRMLKGGEYKGTLKNGQKHGKGQLIQKSITYDCTWVNGLMKGPGRYIMNNGEQYVGYLLDFEANGYGKMIRQNGDVYEGNWIRGVLNGKGTLRTTGGAFYEGNWIDGMLSGNVYYRLKNGDVFEGEFVEGLKNGKGKLTRNDGWVTEGVWREDEYVGKSYAT